MLKKRAKCRNFVWQIHLQIVMEYNYYIVVSGHLQAYRRRVIYNKMYSNMKQITTKVLAISYNFRNYTHFEQ